MKSNVEVKTDKKEYPELSFEQVKLLTKYLNAGMSEEEAYKEVLK